MTQNNDSCKAIIEYPCQWLYKVIGTDREKLQQAIMETIGTTPCEISLSNTSSSGKYLSLNVEITVQDEEERNAIYPASVANSAMMFSGFTAGTTYRWITSERGRRFTHHPWTDGAFLGSGPGDVCLEQAEMHGEAQWKIIRAFIDGNRMGISTAA